MNQMMYNQFYLENLYLPLTIFVAFPLVYDLMPKLKMSYASYALILVVTIRLADIYYTHRNCLNQEMQNI